MGGDNKEYVSPCPEIDLPVVDLSENSLGGPNRKSVVKKLIDSFSTFGFCLITGLEGYDEDALYKAIEWFYYGVTEKERYEQLATKAFNPNNDNIYRGYFPLVEGQLSHKRGYDVGPTYQNIPEEHHDNPLLMETPTLKLPGREKEVDEFHKVLFHHRDLARSAADLLMTLIAEAGGEESNYFDSLFAGGLGMNTFRPIMYPQRVDGIPELAYLQDGRIISTPAHQDSGYLTLLQTFDYPGLEIQLDGVWFSIPPKRDTVVVNVGENMARMSNWLFKATIHRVIDIGRDRMSLPFFYEPHCDANINFKLPAALLPEGTTQQGEEEEFPFAAFLLNKLPIYVEYASICENIPDWMKKKYLDRGKTIHCWAKSNGIGIDGASFEDKLNNKG